MKILITGATGHLGSAIVETLMKQMPADQISVLVRQAETVAEMQSKGLQAYQGNYDDIASLEKAMQDIHKVVLVSATDEGNRMQQHRNVVDAAKKAGVKHVAYTSRSLHNKETLINKLMIEHFLTEDYIMKSGLQYTIFQNALYMDVLPLFLGQKVFETGIFQPAGEGKVAFALRQEMGEAMANTLMEEETGNKIYKFTGGNSYSFYNVATALTELSGKEVQYTPNDVVTFTAKMREKGLPDQVIQKIVDFNLDIKNGQEEEVTNDLENKLGRKPASLKEGLKIIFGL